MNKRNLLKFTFSSLLVSGSTSPVKAVEPNLMEDELVYIKFDPFGADGGGDYLLITGNLAQEVINICKDTIDNEKKIGANVKRSIHVSSLKKDKDVYKTIKVYWFFSKEIADKHGLDISEKDLLTVVGNFREKPKNFLDD